METTKELFKLSVSLIGVKKRCRKSERHLLSGGYMPYNDGNYDQNEVETMAKKLISDNMKQVDSKIIVNLNHIKQGDFVQTWEPFSKKNVAFELKSSLENALQ